MRMALTEIDTPLQHTPASPSGESSECVYLKFLSAVYQQADGELLWIDPGAQRLLDVIAAKDAAGERVTMMQALGLQTLLKSSLSTMARKIRILDEAQLIDITLDAHDKRIKYVRPSEKAFRYYRRLSQCMQAL